MSIIIAIPRMVKIKMISWALPIAASSPLRCLAVSCRASAFHRETRPQNESVREMQDIWKRTIVVLTNVITETVSSKKTEALLQSGDCSHPSLFRGSPIAGSAYLIWFFFFILFLIVLVLYCKLFSVSQDFTVIIFPHNLEQECF